MSAPDSPRRLVREWMALLLAPVAWAAGLGILFPLTEDACTRGTRITLWTVVTILLVLPLAGVLLAWRGSNATGEDSRIERSRFMMKVALGLCGMFGAVLILTAVPIMLLESCRT
jgi:uncharacterized membrane protein (DUF4010 family)